MINWLVDRMHVGTPDAEVEAEIRRRAKPDADLAVVDEYVRLALERHHANRDEYRRVMSGRWS